jgi:hypothetical protein
MHCVALNAAEYWHSVSCSKISCFWWTHIDARQGSTRALLWSCIFSTCSCLEFCETLYAGFRPFMKPHSPLEWQNFSTLHIHSSVRTSQYTACCQQKAQSVKAVKENNGSVLWESYGAHKYTVRVKCRDLGVKPRGTTNTPWRISNIASTFRDSFRPIGCFSYPLRLLYFYYWYFVDSWNQVEVTHWKLSAIRTFLLVQCVHSNSDGIG